MYSQICDWLNDFVDDEPPSELVDVWDLTEWLEESDILNIFSEHVHPTFNTKKAQADSTQILHGLIWEYFLFRRSEALHKYKYDSCVFDRLKNIKSIPQHSSEWFTEKSEILTASEFSHILNDGAARFDLLKSKTSKRIGSAKDTQDTVCLSSPNGKIPPLAWGHRFEPVIKQLYAAVTGSAVYSELGRVRHPTLNRLAASPDGVIENGALLEIKAPVTRDLEKDNIPYEYYCQMQIQMEVCDVDIGMYCECRIRSGDVFVDLAASLPYVGALVVYGNQHDFDSLKYIYSPLFPDTKEGRQLALDWVPEHANSVTECPDCMYIVSNVNGDAEFVQCNTCSDGNMTVLERKVWQVEDFQIIKVLRNPRWWSTVGYPEYVRFMKDLDAAKKDPLYLTMKPFTLGKKTGPLFMDEDELFGPVKNTIE